jgi:peptidoglycan/LPS O-acetylase OafA/YrhL
MRRIAELDALRGIAAGIILLFHLNPVQFFYGWTGVDLFFVLSGYLITSIILRYHDEPHFFRTFYIRRGLRIWPIYYILFVALVLGNRFLPQPQKLDAWPYYATYTQNVPLYFGRPMPPFNPAFDHTWTLALEEQFYLIWPLVIAWAGRRRAVWVCLATMALSWKLRAGGDWIFWLAPRMSERLLLARADGFALGGLLAVGLLERERIPHRLAFIWRYALGGIGLISGIYLVRGLSSPDPIQFLGLPTPLDPANTILAVGAFYTALVGLILAFERHPVLAPLRWPPLLYLGQISYGLYLYHYVIYWMIDGGTFPMEVNPIRACLKIAVTILVSAISWHALEKPILRFKDRFSYRERPNIPATLPDTSSTHP